MTPAGATAPAGTAAPAVEVTNLSVTYDSHPVLLGVSLQVGPGEVVGVVGPNGAGKSTLFRALVGLVPLTTGTVRLLGGPVEQGRRWVAYLPQREALDWDFPVVVWDAVLMGRFPHLPWGRRPGAADRAVAARALEALGIADLRDRHIGELSGGQQQRVLLARALAQEARVLLLDEPFIGVDAATEATILALLPRLRTEGRTVLVVDHDLVRVRETYDRVLLLNQRLVAAGPPGAVLTEDLLRATYGGRLAPLEAMVGAEGTGSGS
ncbi:MAG: metal ABC transporter ATP-binding protein [Armatimonadota bacterium]|nr:metal ABC transporter ATP-binding protein [Armatimonadota bacterium]MDR7449524.1 metal ABC transporter ATP-binding protein [Armatimonadota bacterium]MDR7460544.1 metal ABC transporter ATP-binding protein [Armatimonadota bacterium]MDR7479708.1 metal ABC transporter ATP-binding protein [Armatimonadota bacterium]MDR7489109.1 metal ABC transporter ATP-binding protein [Armatimonadota bacterium]